MTGIPNQFMPVVRAVTLFVLVFTYSCKKPEAAPPPPVGVTVAPAVKKDVSITGEWVAVTDGFVNAQITPQVSGYLIGQTYDEGSPVKKGQILFEIDPRPLQATVDKATADLAQAKAQHELSIINVKRDKPLAEARAVSRSTLDNETQTELVNKASVDAAQASVDTAELNLSFTKVASLVDGIAGQASMQVGNLVGPSSVLTTVSQVDPIKVYFSISEQEYLELSARAKLRGKADLLSSDNTIKLKLTLADGKVYPHPGRIIFVDRSVSSQTGSLRLAASFDNPGNLLRPGQFGHIQAETDLIQNAVVVPQRAVNELQGVFQVYAVDTENVAHLRTVTLGSQLGENVMITSGLDGTEEVVTDGMEKLKEGAKVEPHFAPPAPTTAHTNDAPSAGN